MDRDQSYLFWILIKDYYQSVLVYWYNTVFLFLNAYYTSDKCYEALQHRDGKIIIEVVTGTVTGENGDGQIDYQGYIKYHGDLAVGTRVESVMIYNPDNNYIDDIMYRADTIIE